VHENAAGIYMKIRQLLIGQAARSLVDKNYGASHRVAYDLIKGLKERYYFFQGPSRLEELELSKGIVFVRGTFNDKIKIERLLLFKSAILCESAIDLDDCDVFLDDVIEFSSQILGGKVEENREFGRLYISQMEVEFSASIQKFSGIFSGIGEEISELISKYGNSVESYRPSALSLGGSTVSGTNIKVEPFKIEERIGFPRHENIYYSAAPLKTKDHQKILEKFERLLLE